MTFKIYCVAQYNFRGQHPWRVRERLLEQAINKTIALGGKYVCAVRFENVDAQWQAMYGTVIGYYREMDNVYNATTTSWVEELPEYDQPDESNEDSGNKTIDTIVPVESSTTQSGTSDHGTTNSSSLSENGAESNPDIVIF